MAEDAQLGLEPYAIDEDDFVDAGPRPGLGVIVAAVLAVAASAGFAWWFAGPDRGRNVAEASAATPAPAPVAEPVQPLRFAAADPDPNQVRRAWSDVRQGYVDGGAEALVRASQACARALPSEPQSLDYCLAYDHYAAAIAQGGDKQAAEADWFADSAGRDLALARTALPEGVDASNRLEQVAALTRAVLPKPVAKKSKAKVVKVVRYAPTRRHVTKAKHHRHVLARSKAVSAVAPVRRKDIPAGDAVLTARDGQAPPPDVILNRGQVPDFFDPPH